MKKIICLMAILFLAGTAFAQNNYIQPTFAAVQIREGWNLIPLGAYLSTNFEKSTIKSEDFLAMWMYDIENKKYVNQNSPGAQEFLTKTNLYSGSLGSYYVASAAWVYSKKGGDYVLNFPKPESPAYPKTEQIKLSKGWNFLHLIPNMFEKTIKEFSGNCKITNIQQWDQYNQKWGNPTATNSLAKILETKLIMMLGTPLLFKVDNDCQFSNSSTISPPTLPA